MDKNNKTVQIRISSKERQELDELAAKMGLTLPALTKMFYSKLLTEGKLPFNV
ncbi:type II toxin-antitoxin system RelB/DinJ family antitoxin [Levilactobacillus tujiorum]|uniref:type II toxin-antitoxin system RelB/DinJ family antitoxin n=1 Tax=Levilactobacillus tujiorum TaxID=2912243 RepID=UPI0014572AD1|nr:type II toxin-antitoxin system RelB/DinJ family antitoxin [Levilactobacillus tujiorum]NLR32833.1 type II toxin-antitoxin system RelB/DinJ family antitoxin [Levilactobacillus tujiorum]